MKLKASNPFVVWAAFGGLDIERNFTLCQLFWRCVWHAPIKFICIVGIGVMVSTFGLVLELFGIAVWINLGIFDFDFFIPWAVSLGFVVGILLMWGWNSTIGKTTLVSEAYRGWKDNYCPIVEVER